MDSEKTYCGFVAIIGRPNVGKSTLLNVLMSRKLSSVSRKPQTTRQQIRGIKTVAHKQVIFVDTPGIHQRKKTALDKAMNKAAWSSLEEVNAILFVVEAKAWQEMDSHIAEHLAKLNVPIILVINKVDLLADKAELLPFIDSVKQQLPQVAAILPISASKEISTQSLLDKVFTLLPESPHYYANDQWTDRGMKFLAGEIVREKLMRFLGQELPYVSAVEIESFKDTKKHLELHALIWVERDSQKAIVIGKQGAQLKKIGSNARLDMENLFAKKVVLKTWVKVKSGWTDNDKALESFGYKEF